MSAKALLLLAAVLVALLATAVFGFSMRGGGGERAFVDSVVLVPVVVGLSEQNAVAAIEQAGLQPEVRYVPTPRAKRAIPRYVVSQGPSARITSRGQR